MVNAKFHKQVRPNDTVRLEIENIRVSSRMAINAWPLSVTGWQPEAG